MKASGKFKELMYNRQYYSRPASATLPQFSRVSRVMIRVRFNFSGAHL